MPLFKCSKCNSIENTALGNFWCNREAPLCSECHSGKWHGRFEKVDAVESGYYKDQNGYIYSPKEVDIEKMEWIYNCDFKIIGKA